MTLLFALTLASQSKPSDLKVFDPAWIDRKADPCVDFYQFGCGTWAEKNPPPPDRPVYGRDTELFERNLLLLREILEKTTDQKIGDFYSSCMDEAAIEKKGKSPLEPELAKIDALADKAQLAPLLAQLHRDGSGALFNFRAAQDYDNAEMMIAEADQGGLGLPERDFYFRKDKKSAELRSDYLAHVANMLKLLGEPEADAKKHAQEVMAMETELAKASLPIVDRRDPKKLHHPTALEKLQSSTPGFVWSQYLAAVGSPAVTSMNVAVPTFFRSMDALVKKHPLPELKTYLRWHLVHATSDMLPDPFVREDFEFYGKKLRGAKELKARWKRCIEMTDLLLGEELGKAYVQRAFAGDAKTKALEMVHQIEKAMEGDIRGLDWMSDATKQRAQEKLGTLANKIGYPDKWRDYSKLIIQKGDAFGNLLRATEFETQRQLAKIGKPVERGEWFMTPPTVNAYYDPQLNEINFPAGILQPPFYDTGAEISVNYGDTGATIGHELTHGFDDEGRQFDAKGNLHDWWTKQDAKAFDQRAQCLVKEYNGFIAVDDVHVNGKLTLGENIADLGGIKIARLAYLASQPKDGGKPDASGFTADQRFFLSYAQGWCTNRTPEALRLMATTNPHSPEKYRVNGVVMNVPEFKQAFSCKDGAPMAAKKPCAIW